MADQCIVCLEDLNALAVPDASIHDDLQVAGGTEDHDQQSTHPSTTTNDEPVALIKPCNHVLHDECLRAWSQKANSCPICRQTFNLVEVLDKVGGMFSPSSASPNFAVARKSKSPQNLRESFLSQIILFCDLENHWSDL